MQNFVGLDVHKSSIYAVVLDKEGNQILESAQKHEAFLACRKTFGFSCRI